MKFIEFVFVTFLTHSSFVFMSDDCESWPENLKSLRDCCEVPEGPNPVILNYCFKTRCAHLNQTDDEQNECGARCFANMTLLLDETGVINKNIVKRIYNIHASHSPEWLKVINKTVDTTCDYNLTKSTAESLAAYFDCINSNLEENCASFVNSLECDHVQEHFEKCNNVSVDCEKWPENMMDIGMCCIVPRLFTRKIYQNCRHQCFGKELFHDRRVKCIRKCMFSEAKIKTDDGLIDYDAVTKTLIENSKNNSHWFDIIGDVVKHCSNKIQEWNPVNLNENVLDFLLMDCLREELSENCVEFQETSICNKVKRFKMKCPDTSKGNSTTSLRGGRANSSSHQQRDENVSKTDSRVYQLMMFLMA